MKTIAACGFRIANYFGLRIKGTPRDLAVNPDSAIRNPHSPGDGMKERKLIRRVTLETERTFILRSRGERRAAWCEACGAEVQMARVEVAAVEIGASELVIYQLVESGALHFTEDGDGRVLVCLKSLRQECRHERKGL
jgi:hypothetical protein